MIPPRTEHREDDTFLRLALLAGRMGTWTRDLADDSMRWSREFEALLGLPEGGLRGRLDTFLERVHPDDLAALLNGIDRAIAGREDCSVEFRARHENGEWRWMNVRGRAVYDTAGKAVSLHGVGIDFTERRLAEDARLPSRQSSKPPMTPSSARRSTESSPRGIRQPSACSATPPGR